MWDWFFGSSDDEPTEEQDLASMILEGIAHEDFPTLDDITPDQCDALLSLTEMAYGEDWGRIAQ
jgi:hypothetical protein